MNLYDFRQGEGPLLISIPHSGTWIPDSIAARLTPLAHTQPDCDWFVDRLYDLPAAHSASVLTAKVSRYVVDLNRSPDDTNLYPGQNTTGLCSTITFAGDPLYHTGAEPSAEEIRQRVETYWRPYHDRLQAELRRLTQTFGYAVLLDAHSIASRVPRLFAGVLPDWNFGTSQGSSCGPVLAQKLQQFAETIREATWVINGRFVGGYITRHYGQPTAAAPVFAFQLELSQATYLDEPNRQWSAERAELSQRRLQDWLEWLLAIRKEVA